MILALERTIPLSTEAGLEAGNMECEIAGISATFSVECSLLAWSIVIERVRCGGKSECQRKNT